MKTFYGFICKQNLKLIFYSFKIKCLISQNSIRFQNFKITLSFRSLQMNTFILIKKINEHINPFFFFLIYILSFKKINNKWFLPF